MGFKVPELKAASKSPLAEGVWEVEFKKFTSGVSAKKKTPFVQAVFKVTDEDAVDTDGEAYKRDLYADTFYLTEAAMWRIKKFASEAEIEIPDAGDEFDSLADYAKALSEAFGGLSGTVEVEHEEFEDKDGNDRVKAVVAEYNL